MTTPIVRSRAALSARIAEWRKEGATIGVVPTMGALHAGHLSLVRAAQAGAERVIVTLFVNPRQFDVPEDYARYPRTEESDAAILAPLGVDALYVPDPEEVYPPGFATTVSMSGLTDVLCGARRPGHFDGVTTVVTKLFRQTGADRAWFGEKDFQQLRVVQRLSADLDLGVEVIGCPTVREDDGLALSSRNVRLSAAARAVAPVLSGELGTMAAALRTGEAGEAVATEARARLLAAGFSDVEYLDLRATDDLRLLDHAGVPSRLFGAAWIDGVRLIDNVPVT
ncbi:Pantothenate synthetase [Roseivivax jejudonensis]|uniref:Pantothenate synthetase n=1 Tax=Roseivivax jejudonensis TaxID=1529041 RepID=A0A1X6ZKG4_9RHOB|nr:pantoate--beta-alanine ligase [Roseivivax jejudonensis]SLN52034.1 Pantothenate synthetase [Roseivivax jejudonensis]